MPVHMCPLQKCILRNHGVEFGIGHKVVFAPLLLLTPRRPGGVRNRGHDFAIQLTQSLHQAGFTSSAGCRDDEKIAWVVHEESVLGACSEGFAW